MSEEFNLRSKAYWHRLGWGVFTGLLGAIGAFIFLGLMNFGLSLVWPNPPSWEPFSGSWTIVVIMTVAGFLVGLLHHFSTVIQPDVFEALDEGRMDPKPVPSSVLASLISLVGGFSLGPEVPSGMLSAGLGTWLSEWRKLDKETSRTNVMSSVSAAYAGLFSSPTVMLVILLESPHIQSVAHYGLLFIAGMAALVGFALFYWLGGETFSTTLGLVQPDPYDLEMWHIALSLVLGILAIPIAILLPISVKVWGRLVAPLNKQPVVRGTVGGVVLGLLGMALPITLFLGTEGLTTVTEDAAEIGVALLIVFAIAKIFALSGALSFGMIGGPIFPLLFVGGTVGSLINLIFPQIPLGLAVGCMVAAVPAVIVPIPITMGLLAMLIVGLSPMDGVPVVTAALVAFTVSHGLMAGKNKQEEAA